MFDIEKLVSLILVFSVTILYAFTYIEILFILYRVFSKEKFKPPVEFLSALFCIPLFLFAISYFAGRFPLYNIPFDSFFVSLGLFLSSVGLFALGLIMKETWEQKIKEMNIKLLSVYSLWIIQGIYLAAVIICFILALVSLVYPLM